MPKTTKIKPKAGSLANLTPA